MVYSVWVFLNVAGFFTFRVLDEGNTSGNRDVVNLRTRGEGAGTGTPNAFSEPDMLLTYAALGGVGFVFILARPPP